MVKKIVWQNVSHCDFISFPTSIHPEYLHPPNNIVFYWTEVQFGQIEAVLLLSTSDWEVLPQFGVLVHFLWDPSHFGAHVAQEKETDGGSSH